jgi:hypothetical protein
VRRLAFRLILPFLLLIPAIAWGGVIDPCLSTVTSPGASIVCPAGDGTGVITVTLRDRLGYPIQGVPAADIEAVFCDPPGPCPVASPVYADAATDVNGQTTISGIFGVSGVRIIAQSIEIGHPDDCSTPYCTDISARSPDINRDGRVDLTDLSFLARVIESGLFDNRCDYNGDGAIDAVDFTAFAPHYLHECSM